MVARNFLIVQTLQSCRFKIFLQKCMNSENWPCQTKTFPNIIKEQLLTIYKTFVRSCLDYADIIYDKHFNESFKEKLEKVRYSAAFIITDAIKSTSPERFYKELRLESLSDRGWYRKLVFFYEKVKGLTPPYLQF